MGGQHLGRQVRQGELQSNQGNQTRQVKVTDLMFPKVCGDKNSDVLKGRTLIRGF